MLRARRLPIAAALAAAIAALAVAASSAGAVTTNCAVYASGGYANCLSYAAPSDERVKAWHSAGLPYRFQLTRFSDGARWGWWQWNDLNHHVVSLSLSGVITAQVDNLGTANPASYDMTLQ